MVGEGACRAAELAIIGDMVRVASTCLMVAVCTWAIAWGLARLK